MPKIFTISAKDFIKFLENNGFTIDRQKGSHIVLKRESLISKQVFTVPNHKEISIGTTKALYNQAKKYIDINELDKFFYGK